MKILLSKSAKRQLGILNSRIQQKIMNILNKFQNHQPVDIIKLKNKNNEFRIRTGNYRIQLSSIKQDFLITKIGKRENFYNVFLI
jgi:mRNA-degrading endonuclease RelE of RelBE toxin-antitoxin system